MMSLPDLPPFFFGRPMGNRMAGSMGKSDEPSRGLCTPTPLERLELIIASITIGLRVRRIEKGADCVAQSVVRQSMTIDNPSVNGSSWLTVAQNESAIMRVGASGQC